MHILYQIVFWDWTIHRGNTRPQIFLFFQALSFDIPCTQPTSIVALHTSVRLPWPSMPRQRGFLADNKVVWFWIRSLDGVCVRDLTDTVAGLGRDAALVFYVSLVTCLFRHTLIFLVHHCQGSGWRRNAFNATYGMGDWVSVELTADLITIYSRTSWAYVGL